MSEIQTATNMSAGPGCRFISKFEHRSNMDEFIHVDIVQLVYEGHVGGIALNIVSALFFPVKANPDCREPGEGATDSSFTGKVFGLTLLGLEPLAFLSRSCVCRPYI